MSRGTYKRRVQWTDEMLNIIKTAVHTRDASVPYRLAHTLITEQRWSISHKSVCHQIDKIIKQKG